jgi:UrcA family protein
MNRSKLTVRIVAIALSVVGSAAQLGLVSAALALAVASAGAAVAGLAQPIRYDDLDLARPAGVALLYGRIEAAARGVCGDAQRVGSHIVPAAWQECVTGAIDHAVAAVDRPALTAYHAERKAAARPTRTVALPAQHGRD